MAYCEEGEGLRFGFLQSRIYETFTKTFDMKTDAYLNFIIDVICNAFGRGGGRESMVDVNVIYARPH